MRAELRFPPRVDAIEEYVDDVMSLVDASFDGPRTRIALAETLLNAVVHGALCVRAPGGDRDPVAHAARISEAERWCPPSREIVVEVDVKDDGPTVFVRDPGAGFDWPAARARAEVAPAPDALAGRGLHLVRRGVAEMDWNAAGNEVRLRLRGRAASPDPKPERGEGLPYAKTYPPPPPIVARVHRVLVVDDDPVARRIVRHTLTTSGFAVEEAAGGTDALERLATSAPDLLVLDLVMPDLSGLDVLERLRVRGVLSRCPVILLTGSAPTPDVASRALELGASLVLVKPVPPRELVAQIRRTLATQERIDVLGAERDGLRDAEERIASLLAALSPPRTLVRVGAVVETRVVPAGCLGGDLVDVVDIGPGVFAAVLVDVAGKGGPAALTAAAIRGLARDRFLSDGAIEAVFRAINERLYEDFEATRQHAAVSALIVDAVGGRLYVANAGNPPIVVVRRSDAALEVRSSTPSLGLSRAPKFAVASFALADVARVIAPSDGLVECFGRPSDSIGALAALSGEPLHARMSCPDVESAISWATARDDASLLFVACPPVTP